jgi:GTP-binding protein
LMVKSMLMVGSSTAIGGSGSGFKEYQPYKGEISRRSNGSMIALETGTAFAYAIDKLQDRGKFFIDPGEEVYGGEVVGEHVHDKSLLIR